MAKKKRPDKKYVMHPRFGDEIVPSGHNISDEEIKNGVGWQYHKKVYFPETAIRADISKQNFALFPRKIYADLEKQCRECKRSFLFYALEQKHWFEELGFYVDADCVSCPDCRKKDQYIRKLQVSYQDLIEKENRSSEESGRLKQCALELFQLGYIKDVSKVNAIKIE